MDMFEDRKDKSGLTLKLFRGERMSLLGFNDDDPEDDLVGFAVECSEPCERGLHPLNNRLRVDTNVHHKFVVTDFNLPTAVDKPWFASSYVPGSQRERDRLLFSAK